MQRGSSEFNDSAHPFERGADHELCACVGAELMLGQFVYGEGAALTPRLH
jgi:hypothetical protein